MGRLRRGPAHPALGAIIGLYCKQHSYEICNWKDAHGVNQPQHADLHFLFDSGTADLSWAPQLRGHSVKQGTPECVLFETSPRPLCSCSAAASEEGNHRLLFSAIFVRVSSSILEKVSPILGLCGRQSLPLPYPSSPRHFPL